MIFRKVVPQYLIKNPGRRMSQPVPFIADGKKENPNGDQVEPVESII